MRSTDIRGIFSAHVQYQFTGPVHYWAVRETGSQIQKDSREGKARIGVLEEGRREDKAQIEVLEEGRREDPRPFGLPLVPQSAPYLPFGLPRVPLSAPCLPCCPSVSAGRREDKARIGVLKEVVAPVAVLNVATR